MDSQSRLRPILTVLLLFLASTFSVWAQKGEVIVLDIRGEVDQMTAARVQRVLMDAETEDASAVLITINTLGGRLDAALDIRDAILASNRTTIAYIEPRAISAGAMIALSCKKIVMAPGATMGAATPVYGDGDRASEKVVSFMRSAMHATAERRGRNPVVAEAMVDERVSVPELKDRNEGMLVTLTAEEAQKVGYCDALAKSPEEALAVSGLQSAQRVEAGTTTSEGILTVLTSPLVSAFLIIAGLGGMIFSIKSGHLSVVTALALVALTLYFGAHTLIGRTDAAEILLFIVGGIMLALEVFIIPGFSPAGVIGIVAMAGGLFLALVGRWDAISMRDLTPELATVAGGMAGVIVLAIVLVRRMPDSNMVRRLALRHQADASRGHISNPSQLHLYGAVGIVETPLRPSGVVNFDGERVSVLSRRGMIGVGEHVRVVDVEGAAVRVEPFEELAAGSEPTAQHAA